MSDKPMSAWKLNQVRFRRKIGNSVFEVCASRHSDREVVYTLAENGRPVFQPRSLERVLSLIEALKAAVVAGGMLSKPDPDSGVDEDMDDDIDDDIDDDGVDVEK